MEKIEHLPLGKELKAQTDTKLRITLKIIK